MNAPLELHRFDGNVVGLGCRTCPLLAECGGFTRSGPGWSCMDHCQFCDPKTCDKVCLRKPNSFAVDMLEVGGFGFADIPALRGHDGFVLPQYVPMVHHGSSRADPLYEEFVALPLHRMLSCEGGRWAPRAKSAVALRHAFGLADAVKIVAVATGKDRYLERYWRWRVVHELPAALARLGIACVVAPNYSMFLDDPRPHHLFNRKRSLIAAAELSSAGIVTVPYLQAVSAADWSYWERFLAEHSEVTIVAKEFQTGLANRERGLLAIERLADLQERLRRPLHLVMIGGAKYRRDVAQRFDRWSVIDSQAFMQAVNGRCAVRVRPRLQWRDAFNERLDDRLVHNIDFFSKWVANG